MSRIAARPPATCWNCTCNAGVAGWWPRCCCCGCSVWWCARCICKACQHDFLQRKGDAVVSRVLDLPAHRGMITDRRGEPLAISTPMESLWANPASVNASPEQLKHLAKLLDMPLAEHRRSGSVKTARNSSTSSVSCRRNRPPPPPSSAFPGLYLRREYRRYYPSADVTSHAAGLYQRR